MNITENPNGNKLCISLEGRLDTTTAPKLEKVLAGSLEGVEELAFVVVTFIDNGIAYDPLARKDPDVTLTTKEREIGGLGVYMVKKSMDEISYEYKDGQNILRIKKKI